MHCSLGIWLMCPSGAMSIRGLLFQVASTILITLNCWSSLLAISIIQIYNSYEM
jgi:hypothetical protein